MKKVFLILAAVACIAVSCNRDEKGKVLSPDQSKETLDETMTKAVQMLEVDHWQSTADFITASVEVFDSIKSPNASFYEWSGNTMASWSVENDEYDEICYDLTKVNGTLKVVGDSLVVEEGTGLNLAYDLPDGTPVAGALTVKNSATKALMDVDYYWDSDKHDYTDSVLAKRYLIVPASIEGNLTAGTGKVAGMKLTTDVKLAGEEPRPTDSYAATLQISAEKYVFSITRAKYSPTEVLLDASIKYDNHTVVAASFEAKGNLVFDEEDDIDVYKTTGKVKASFSILDNVQVKGDVNFTEFVKVTEMADSTEALAKAKALAAEKYTNLTLYIDKTAQAKLGWEPSNAEGYWEVIPVVRFTDGSEYMLPEEFFSPNGFPKTVEAVNKALAQMDSFLNGGEEEAEPIKEEAEDIAK